MYFYSEDLTLLEIQNKISIFIYLFILERNVWARKKGESSLLTV